MEKNLIKIGVHETSDGKVVENDLAAENNVVEQQFLQKIQCWLRESEVSLDRVEAQPSRQQLARAAKKAKEESLNLKKAMKPFDKELVEQIKSAIAVVTTPFKWDDVAGLDDIKEEIQTAFLLPLERPDFFIRNGLIKKNNAILLYGPPGSGKSLLASCAASQCGATFFDISAATFKSKNHGDRENLMEILFAYAIAKQPSIIFIDEFDALLSTRSIENNDTGLKSQFMMEINGVASKFLESNVLMIAATSRPEVIDKAAACRFTSKFYVPLPNLESRAQCIAISVRNDSNYSLSSADILKIASQSEGYSCSDLKKILSNAGKRAICDLNRASGTQRSNVRKVTVEDILGELAEIKPSVHPRDLAVYEKYTSLR